MEKSTNPQLNQQQTERGIQEKNKKLLELMEKINIEELKNLGKKIQDQITHILNCNAFLEEYTRIIDSIGNILIDTEKGLFDSASLELMRITRQIREFLKKNPEKISLSETEKTEVQKITEALKKVPELPLTDDLYVPPIIISINSNIRKLLKGIDKI